MEKKHQLSTKPVWKGSLIMISCFFFAACMQHDEGLVPQGLRNQHSSEMNPEAGTTAMMMKRVFTAHLTGGNEVPGNDSQAQGQVIFKLNKDGTEMEYKLIAANIENVRAAHIHCGAPGVNGPVVVPLFSGPKTAAHNGILAEGTITDADVNPLECIGGVSSVDAVLELIRSGEAYVNVHTDQHPPGEIRGQVQ